MVKISSEASGEIIYLGVRDGDTVRSGQLVARIQPDIVNTQLDQSRFAAESSKMAIDVAKAELDRTEADFKRIGELVKKDFATREEYDRARAAYNSAAARYASAQSDYQRSMGVLRQTQATASRTTIFSPMNGVVTYLAVEAGEKVVGTAQMQGTEMMRISDLSTMNAWVDVDENDVALISVGDTARIRVDALRDTVYRGVVYEISHSPRVAAQGTQEEVVNFQVRIRFVDKDVRFRPGMSCNVDIETETRKDVVAVPLGAVTVKQDGSEQGAEDKGLTDRRDASRTSSRPPSMVWIVDKSSVSERIVKTGISDQGYIEILSGVKKGESIVVAPYQAVSKLLRNGAPVKLEDAAARRERFRKMRTE
ncbi:MAG TPA: efflux RND transporter periplasmic adaptor subunit [Bacteroidetes bacterium]|nr:efflux RND transporter periplasmic adaptor subunit [Bacteroidota bacterium]